MKNFFPWKFAKKFLYELIDTTTKNIAILVIYFKYVFDFFLNMLYKILH